MISALIFFRNEDCSKNSDAFIGSAASIVPFVGLSLLITFNRFCINARFSNFHNENLPSLPKTSIAFNSSGLFLVTSFKLFINMFAKAELA